MHAPFKIRILLICFFLTLGSNTKVVADTDGCDMARIYVVKGVNYYQKAIDLCPGYIRPYELLGNEYRKKEETSKAIELFTSAAELGSQNNKLYFLLAELHYERGEIDRASYYLKKSIKLRPNYTKAIALLEKVRNAIDNKGPEIIFSYPKKSQTIFFDPWQRMLSIRGRVIDAREIISFKVAGENVPILENGRFLANVNIQQGPNIIISASDDLGNVSSKTVRLKPLPNPMVTSFEAASLYKKKHAVVVGINDYLNWPRLEAAVGDAEKIYTTLKGCGFDSVILVKNEKATQRKLLTILWNELPKTVGQDDLVLFYFAGHGHSVSEPDGTSKGFIIPVDAGRPDLLKNVVSMEQIRELSSRVIAKHILYIMDSCYSGLGLTEARDTLRPGQQDFLKYMSSLRAVQIITAGGADEEALETDGYGLFTQFLLQALKGKADANGDDFITATELGSWVKPMVSEASADFQTPLYGKLEGNGEVLFSKEVSNSIR